MSDCEKMTDGSLYEYWMSQYIRFQIGSKFNISFFEYLEQPRFRIQAMNRTAERDSSSEVAEANNAANQLLRKQTR